MNRGFYCSECKKRYSHSDTTMHVVDGKQLCPDCYKLGGGGSKE